MGIKKEDVFQKSPSPDSVLESVESQPIYRGPGERLGRWYHVIESDKNQVNHHVIYFHEDGFIVREGYDLGTVLRNGKRVDVYAKWGHVRSYDDESNREFLESLEKKGLPKEFENMGGVHVIRVVGLTKDQELETPGTPPGARVHLSDSDSDSEIDIQVG